MMAVRLKTWLSQERNNSMNIANRRKGPFQIPAKNVQIPDILRVKGKERVPLVRLHLFLAKFCGEFGDKSMQKRRSFSK